jgi:hypothetical protein
LALVQPLDSPASCVVASNFLPESAFLPDSAFNNPPYMGGLFLIVCMHLGRSTHCSIQALLERRSQRIKYNLKILIVLQSVAKHNGVGIDTCQNPSFWLGQYLQFQDLGRLIEPAIAAGKAEGLARCGVQAGGASQFHAVVTP